MRQRNYHCMAAVGKGLYATVSQPPVSSQIWCFISPNDDFAAIRHIMKMYPGIQLLHKELRISQEPGFSSTEIYNTFEFVQYFGKEMKEIPQLDVITSQLESLERGNNIASTSWYKRIRMPFRPVMSEEH